MISKRLLKNEKGIALLMVMGCIVVLMVIVTEFAFNAHVASEVAGAERDRLVSYYLARSGMQLVKLELKYEKDMRSRFSGQNLQGAGVSSDPLCKQVHLSTGVIKGIASGALLSDGSKDGGESKKEKKEVPEGEASTTDSSFDDSGFLELGGDFDVGCDTEESKININSFRDVVAASAPRTPNPAALPGADTTGSTAASVSIYEAQKAMLFSLMSLKDFEPIFNGKPDEIRKVVNAIADWVDQNDRVDEGPGQQGSSEDSEYSGDVPYKVKNGKYTTESELLLVHGVTDEIYEKLLPHITVFGDNKLNLCQSRDEMIRAFAMRYMQSIPGMGQISEDDDAKWSSIVDAVRQACDTPNPNATQVASALGLALGAQNVGGLASLLTTTNRFYRIESLGTAGQSRVKLTAVIDAGSPQPMQWKTVYFRTE